MNKIQIINDKFICPMSGNEITERGNIMFAACAKCEHNILGQFVNKYVYCNYGESINNIGFLLADTGDFILCDDGAKIII